MEVPIYVYLDRHPTKGLKWHTLRLSSEKPDGKGWYNCGNVYLELIDGSYIPVLQKLDAKTSPIKNEELRQVVADLISKEGSRWRPLEK